MQNNRQDKNEFTYTYSAEEQAELRKIRDKYIYPTESEGKMERLRRLDASVTRTAQTVALVFGVIGTLILGFGMSIVMTDVGASLGFSGSANIVIGTVIGVVGAAFASAAYPIYNVIVKIKRKRLAPEIIRLTDELMK